MNVESILYISALIAIYINSIVQLMWDIQHLVWPLCTKIHHQIDFYSGAQKNNVLNETQIEIIQKNNLT